jgi:hypothetical protein
VRDENDDDNDDYDEEDWNLASISYSAAADPRAFPVVQKRDNYLY